MLDTDTKRRIDTARDILVGKVPDPKSQVEQITIALIYKFMDDMDAESEEMGGKRKFFAGDYARYGWSKLMQPGLGGHEMLNLYAEGIGKMPENPGIPPLFRDIFKNAFLPYRDPETLKAFLKIINEFQYEHSERLGDAFEYLLSVLGSQGDAGQFRTPRHIIDFIVEIVDPKKNEVVLDPACGTAGFLISSYKHILKANTDNKGHSTLTPDERARLAANFKGYDISPDMVRLSLVNLYLHGFADPHIVEYDTLTSLERWNEHADVILANPPFMSPKGGIRPHNRFGVQSKRSEVLFVSYMAEHLTPNGRAGIIVPEGIIFQSQNTYKQLRKLLVEDYLVAVVSLPAGVFNPYSGVKTSILILDKSLAKRADTIVFFKIANDGFNLGAQRRPIDKNDLPQVLAEIEEYLRRLRAHESVLPSPAGRVGPAPAKAGGEGFRLVLGLIVPKEKIAASGDYNLSGERYRVVQTRIASFPMVSLSDVCLIRKGSTITRAEMVKGRVPVVAGGQQPSGYHNVANRDGGVITVSASGAYAGYIAFWPQSIFASDCSTLEPLDARLLPEYLFRAVKFKQQAIYAMQVGMGQPHVYPKDLALFRIPLPPLEVQKEIVAEIEGYQKVIDGARAVLDNYRPRIPIDPDWPMVELGEVIKLSSGRGLTQSNMLEGPYPVYGGNGKTGTHTEYFLETANIVIGRVGAYCGAVHITAPKAWVTDNGLYVTEFKQEIDLGYLAQVMAQLNLNQFAKVGGQPSISQMTVCEQTIPLPPLADQQAIVAEIEAEQALVAANRELIARMEKKIQATLARVWGENELVPTDEAGGKSAL